MDSQQVPDPIAQNALYGKRRRAIEPETGNGYEYNPLAALKTKKPPEYLTTVEDYVSSLRTRSENILRWTKNRRHWADYSAVVLEMMARMEGDLQSLKELLKSSPDKTKDIDTVLSHLEE